MSSSELQLKTSNLSLASQFSWVLFPSTHPYSIIPPGQTLTNVFGISCRHLKIKPKQQTSETGLVVDQDGLLRSILISQAHDTKRAPKRPARSRSKSGTRYTKTYSSDVSDLQSGHPDFIRNQRRSASDQSYPGSPLPSARYPLHAIPSALVFSGLENASVASQRSLDRALAERKIILSPDHDRPAPWQANDDSNHAEDEGIYGQWSFPPDFVAVYVCPADDRHPPQILRSLVRIPFLPLRSCPHIYQAGQVFL